MKNKNLSLDEILFIENFNLILTNSQRIITTPEFYSCKPDFIRMANPYAAPHLTLGNLCELWKHGKFIDQCDKCGQIRYIVSGSGNLGGGISNNSGICLFCKQFSRKVGPRTGPSIYTPMLFAYMKFRKNKSFEGFGANKKIELIDLIWRLKI